MRAIALIIVLVQLLACGAEYGNEASVKFVPIAAVNQAAPSYYLTQEVHKRAWLIRYGFTDNDLCRSSDLIGQDAAAEFEQQIRASIVKAIKLWLQPLREMDSEIVNEFNLELVNTKTIDSDRQTHTLVHNGSEQLGIVFHCAENGRTTAYPNSFIKTMATASYAVREIHMYHYLKQGKHLPHDKMTDIHMFMMTSIIHELGHAFGLADTYASPENNSKTNRGTINYSTGGSKKTVGKQPMSMMGFSSLVGVNSDGEHFITVDDIDGVRWLYRLAYDNASINECPEDYVVEKDTLGCVPRFPLIFAVKKGDIATIAYVARDDPTTMNICDQQGNTALFYAKQHRDRHGSRIDEFLLKHGADPSIACAKNVVVPDVQLSTADAEPYSYRGVANTGCGTIRYASSPEHTLLLLLALLGVPLLFARGRGFVM